MKTFIKKSNGQNKNQAAADSFERQKNRGQENSEIIDNRMDVTVQGKFQSNVNKSHRMIIQKNQLKTISESINRKKHNIYVPETRNIAFKSNNKRTKPVQQIHLNTHKKLQCKKNLQIQQFNKRIHLKGHSVTMNAPIQKYMGIEAELTVPVSKAPPPEASDDQKIRNFFSQGVQGGTEYTDANNGYHTEADHDGLGDMIDNYREVLNKSLKKNGFEQIKKNNKIANMEYVTDPGRDPRAYDEETDEGLREFRNSIMHMAANMNTVVKNSKKQTNPIGNGFQYGIPPQTTWDNFSNTNQLQQKEIRTVRQVLANRITDKLYVQINAGILPKRISKYLERLSEDTRLVSLREQYDDNTSKERAWVKLLTRDAADDASKAVETTQGLSGEVQRSSSLKGFVSLIMSYIYGFYFDLRRGGHGIWKNAVPALSKVPLHQVLLEIDRIKRPDEWGQNLRDNLRGRILHYAGNRLNGAPVRKQEEDDDKVNGALNFNWQTEWLPEILNGKKDRFTVKTAGINTIAPLDHPLSSQINIGTNRAQRNTDNTKEKYGKEFGGAIPMELRFIQEHPTPNQLLDLVNRAITQVRVTNGPWYRCSCFF